MTRSVLNLALPPSCLCCGAAIEQSESRLKLCPECSQGLSRLTEQSSCQRCGHTVGPYGSCPGCADDPPPFDAAIRIGAYAGPLAELVRTVKFRAGLYAIPLLADLLLAKLLQGDVLGQTDLVTAVPLYWYRFYRRGYNQAVLLVRALGRRWPPLTLRRVLVRTRNTRPQVGLNKAARRENVRGAFRVRRPQEIEGQRILLVDDVMTTGATLGACVQALRKGGAGSVAVAVAAVAESDRLDVA